MILIIPPVGLHILSELYDCDKMVFTQLNGEMLHAALAKMIRDYQLTELGVLCHEFDKGAVTCLVALAESHIAIHSWPEIGYVTIEVYVCNYQCNNSTKAEQVHASLVSWFAPTQVESRRLTR